MKERSGDIDRLFFKFCPEVDSSLRHSGSGEAPSKNRLEKLVTVGAAESANGTGDESRTRRALIGDMSISIASSDEFEMLTACWKIKM